MADTSSIAQRLSRSLARYLHVISAPPHPQGAPVWTASMSMAVALIVFLVLTLHPYDEYLSRMFTSPDSDLRYLRLITDIGLSKWYVIPAFIIIVCLIAIDWQHLPLPRRKRLHLVYTQASYAFWAICLAGMCTAISKFLIGRARPPFIDTLGTGHFSPFAGSDDLASFPSGHSTTMGAVGAILALWFPRWRVPIILATMFIAFTRIIAQAHYPTDTVAGYAIGFLIAITLARFLARRGAVFLCKRGQFFPVIHS
ncbi:phosphatase PAP2 family protein [Phyllobacterium sp. K27]